MILDFNQYAKFVITYSASIERRDKVLIIGASEAIPLIKELYREILKVGAHPIRPYIEFPEMEYIFYLEANQEQLNFLDPFELNLMQKIDALILIEGKMNTRELSTIPSHKIQQKKMASAEIMNIFYERQAKDQLKWTMIPYPTNAMAQEANLSQEELAKIIVKGCFLDREDPIASWKQLHDKQEIYCEHLNSVDNIRIINKDTDISMSVKGRKWINSDGRGNLPDGEIFTGPVEDSVNGHIKFSYPTIDKSHVIEDIEFEFKNGEIIEARASNGQEALDALLHVPGARKLGEVAIGTNWGLDTFIGNILFDEKIGGTIHIAIGNGYPETGSQNKSAIHKDLLCDMKENGQIFADGKLIYEKGNFLIP